MEPIIIYRGTDEKINLKLWQDQDKTIPINIDDLEDLEVRISIGGLIIGKWNKSGSSDFDALIREDAYNYYFWFQTDGATKTGVADMWIEVKETDAELDDSVINTIRSSLMIYNVEQKPY